MSIVLYVYAPDAPLEREVIARTAAKLEETARWEIAFVPEAGGPLERTGVVRTQTVIGWHPGSRAGPDVLAAFERGDAAAQSALYSQEAFASASLSVRTRGSPDWDDAELAETAAAAPEPFRAENLGANTLYAIETHARRNKASVAFQQLLWSVIGVMSNGIMDDPQEGEFMSPREEIAAEEATGTIGAARERARRARPGTARVMLQLWASDGWTLLMIALGLMLILQLACIFFFGASLGTRRMLWHALPVGGVAMSWYLLRKGDRDGWWLLVLMAAAILAQSLTNLPRASGSRAALLWVRIVGHAIVVALLMMRPVREFVGVVFGRDPEDRP